MRLSTRAQIESIERGVPNEVRLFREEWLPNGTPFLDREEARGWLDQLRDDAADPVKFQFDDQDDIVAIPIQSTRMREELTALAEQIASDFQWSVPSVRAWLITAGARPVINAVVMTTPDMPDMPRDLDDEDRIDALASFYMTPPMVTLEVRVDTPPKVVLDYYREAQRQYEHDIGVSMGRSREMAEWTLELVAFTVNRNDGRGWPEILAEWNSTYGTDWSFESSKKINLAARAGYRNLMGRELSWKGPSVRSAGKKMEND